MTGESFRLDSPELAVSLRSIVEADGENLREWKNANRFSFFFQDIISREQQARWFQSYLQRPADYMFIVLEKESTVGCMGFRMGDHYADIYNVIRANPAMGGRGLMSDAIRLMCSFIAGDFSTDIRAQVLRLNPALQWYAKNGFRELSSQEAFVEVKLDLLPDRLCAFQRINS